MQDTSLRAYSEIQGSLDTLRQEVYNAFKKFGSCTDLEISNHLNYSDPNKVRPRRNELVKMGYLKQVGKRRCTISKRMAIVWDISQ